MTKNRKARKQLREIMNEMIKEDLFVYIDFLLFANRLIGRRLKGVS